MIRTRLFTLLCIVVILAGVAAPGLPVAADDQTPTVEEKVMREAVGLLGWPNAIATQRMYDLDENDDTMILFWPPGDALQFVADTKTSATNGGSYDDETIQYARILSLGDKGGKLFLDKMVENGYSRSSYQGRPAAIVQSGQKMCNAGGLVGYLSEYVKRMLRGIFGSAMDNSCPYASAGYISWTCGAYTFVARDDTGKGGEEAIAAALYTAAEHQGLCGLADTLVILAQTNDVSGTKEISKFVELGQQVNSYYGQNAYGNVSLAYTYLDADGDGGTEDWFTVDANMADYQGKETEFGIAAIQKAFEAGAPQEELELSQVIVVYPGSAVQESPEGETPVLSTLCAWKPEYQWHEIQVGPPENRSTVFAGSLIVVAENDGLGDWAHEIGHSLYGQYKIHDQYTRIGDRYNYNHPAMMYGYINYWGLMGSGNSWGDPRASNPVHMSAFSKETAEWMEYTVGTVGERYTLSALETTGTGSALKIDDPNSADPQDYMLMEARQSGGAYGAPESGVAMYRVNWSSSNQHHVVNVINPPRGITRARTASGQRYTLPTLHDAGDPDGATEYLMPYWKIRFSLYSESTADGYSAVVGTSVYTPTNLVGAVVAPVPAAAPANPPTVAPISRDGPVPDIDLHAWDDQGYHVGLNYATWQYENQIAGAVASGDLQGDEEWIYVPEGTQVRYAVSAEKTRQFLETNPAWAEVLEPQEFATTYHRFDAEGTHTVANGGEGVVPPGIEAPLSAPSDSSLSYKAAPALHYGRNWPENLPLAAFFGAILTLGTVGWVMALVKR